MDVSGVSLLTKNQLACARTENESTSEEDSSSTGWKYLTVIDGDIEYTYIVIGKDMKVLIGKSPVHKDKTKDKKAEGTKDNAAKPDEPADTKQTATDKLATNKVDFLTDQRMLSLTAFYQKKIRETMQNMENQIATNFNEREKVNEVDTKEKEK